MNGRGRGGYFLLLGVVAVFGALSVTTAVRHGLGDIASKKSRHQIIDWQTTPARVPSLGELATAQAGLLRGLSWVPGDPLLLEMLGYGYSLRAAIAWRGTVFEDTMQEAALEQYRRSLARRPMSPYTWSSTAWTLHRLNREPQAMWQAIDRAIRYGIREGGVQLTLARILLARWDEAGPERQESLRHIYRESRGRAARQLKQLASEAGREDLLPPR